MDELEKYIKDHRHELDRYSPPKKVWSRIQSELGRKKHTLSFGISAAAIIVIVVAIGALLRINSRGSEETRLENDIIKIYTGIRETELYYDNLINDLIKQAQPLLTEYPDVQKELNEDMTKLDSLYIDIRKDLKDNISNKEVIEAMINNYRIKIRILNDLLDQLKENESTNLNDQSHAL
jgi:hypothetical protein